MKSREVNIFFFFLVILKHLNYKFNQGQNERMLKPKSCTKICVCNYSVSLGSLWPSQNLTQKIGNSQWLAR